MRFHAIFVLFVLPLVLLSQEKPTDTVTDATDPFSLKTTVVVTSTKTQVDIEKVPASTSVVTSQELQLRSVVLLDQALNTLEGVIVARGKGAADTLSGVGMRGFAGRGTGQSRTLVLLDGEQMNDGYTGVLSWQTMPVSEVDRVEVVRGPFSSLYGGNAMGGVINIMTRPVEKRHMEFFGRYGSQDTVMYSGNASGRFWNKLGLTAGYQRLQSGGYLSRLITATASTGSTGTPITGATPTVTTAGARTFIIGDGGNNWSNQDSWRLRGEYTIDSKTTAFFQYIRQRYAYGYDAYTSYLRNASGTPVDNGTFTFSDAGVAKKFSITPKTFLSGPGAGINNLYSGRLIRTLTSRQRLQVSGGVYDMGTNWYTTPGSSATLSSGGGVLSDRPARSWHGEGQWSWEQSEHHNFLFGGEIRHESVNVAEYNLTNYAIKSSIENQTYAAQGKNQTQAVYAQDQILVSNRLQLIAGGRLDYWQTKDGSNNSFGTTLVNEYENRSRTSASGKLAGLYQLAGGTTLRASVGTAFRNPSVYNLYRAWQSSSGTLYLSNADLEPEELTSWEVGLRQRIGGRFQVEATYYENRIKNLIYLQTDLVLDPKGKTQIYRNAGRARTRGVDFAMQQRPLAWLQLRETYTFANAVITENAAVPASVGRYVTWVPKHQVAGLLTMTPGRFTGSLTARYVTRMFGTDTNTDVVTGVPGSFDPYFDLSGSAGFRITKNVSFTAGADNLLDRRYFQSSYWAAGRTAFAGLRFQL